MTLKKIYRFLLGLGFSSLLVAMPAQGGADSSIAWQNWSETNFARAKAEKKLVYFELEAIWCHWCHVMEAVTYKDPKVIKLLQDHFIAVKVDQDSRPDLSLKYEDYGWPAIILFDANGRELAKLSGYRSPESLASTLQAFVDDPTPGPSASEAEPTAPNGKSNPMVTELDSAFRLSLTQRYLDTYDKKLGAWGKGGHKLLNWHLVEYALARGQEDKDATSEMMAKGTLNGQRNLIDPVWGGVYQYSTGGNWKEPHFEKIMQVQAENLRIYSLAYNVLRDENYKAAVMSIATYMTTFLSDDSGGFYTSQDADVVPGKHSEDFFKKNDTQRRKIGMPRVDKNMYARENGWAIQGFVAAFSATNQQAYLGRATRSAQWALKNRTLGGGGFKRGDQVQKDVGPFLGDTLAMGRAFLALYAATGDRIWFKHATEAADFMTREFKAADGGFWTVPEKSAVGFKPGRNLEENSFAARFLNLLSHYARDARYSLEAKHAARLLATPALAERTLGGEILLADRELSRAPIHIVVVGSKTDKSAGELFQTAHQLAYPFKVVEWYDAAEGSLPNMETSYPKLSKAAAFACSGTRCSLPAYSGPDMEKRVKQISTAAK